MSELDSKLSPLSKNESPEIDSTEHKGAVSRRTFGLSMLGGTIASVIGSLPGSVPALAATAGAALALEGTAAAQGRSASPYTPNGQTIQGKKQITLTAQPVEHTLLDLDGKQVVAQGYGFNGMIPGPTLVFNQGDHVEITVINRLPEPTAVHWHGVILPNSQDGVPEVGEPSPLIHPGESYTYRFEIAQSPGTHMYHSHVDLKSEILGLVGGFIILPKEGDRDDREDIEESGKYHHSDKDVIIWLHSWSMPQTMQGMALKNRAFTGSPVDTVNSVNAEPDWFSGMLNFFTMNGKSYPNTESLTLKLGETMRVRFFNLNLLTHPIHLHGQNFMHIAEDGVELKMPQSINTISVAPGKTQDILITGKNPGVWPFHCHIAHHQANNYSSGFGGMATLLKIG